MPNKFYQRMVKEVKVRCQNESAGCEWVGKVEALRWHLDEGSTEGEYMLETVACAYSCGQVLM